MPKDQNDRVRPNISSGEVFSLFNLLISVHTTTITPFIRTNFGINANGWNGVGALVLIVLFWAAEETDQIMGGYLALWLFALLVQKGRTLHITSTGKRIHSRYWGDPWLAMKLPFIRNIHDAYRIEPFVAFVIGLTIFPLSPGLGSLWMIGFLTFPVQNVIEKVATTARLQSIDDAENRGELLRRPA